MNPERQKRDNGSENRVEFAKGKRESQEHSRRPGQSSPRMIEINYDFQGKIHFSDRASFVFFGASGSNSCSDRSFEIEMVIQIPY
jgi:hypothetical protein